MNRFDFQAQIAQAMPFDVRMCSPARGLSLMWKSFSMKQNPSILLLVGIKGKIKPSFKFKTVEDGHNSSMEHMNNI